MTHVQEIGPLAAEARRVDADAAVRVAEATHLGPVQTRARWGYVTIITLTAAAIVSAGMTKWIGLPLELAMVLVISLTGIGGTLSVIERLRQPKQ